MHAILSLDLDSNSNIDLEVDTISVQNKSAVTRGLKIVDMNNSVSWLTTHLIYKFVVSFEGHQTLLHLNYKLLDCIHTSQKGDL